MASNGRRAAAVLRRVQGAARDVYDELGWGWREEVYREALACELAPLQVSCEVAMPVVYKGTPLSHVSVRWDMLVENCVLVELKAVKTQLGAAALRQCQRYNAGRRYLCVAINFPDREGAQLQVLHDGAPQLDG